jgi:multicomponent Na+:H+ antiporter subunit F
VTTLLWSVATALLLMAFACLWRADVGPTIQDRLLAVNVAGTKTMVVLVLLATIAGHAFLIDVAIVLGLLNLIITLAATRFIESGRLSSESPTVHDRPLRGEGRP